MEFSKIIGKIDPNLIAKAEDALTKLFLELGTRPTNEHVGTGLGGDPLILTLMVPCKHIATLNMPTAATDGRQFFWNPKFVLKHSRVGLRIIAYHEAFHALYMHPHRRGSRLPKLWNIAVDYIVNNTAMEDLKARKRNPTEEFNKHLGRFMTVKQYADFLKDPSKPPKGFEDCYEAAQQGSGTNLPDPDEDRELTPEEQKEIERRETRAGFYFADPDLSEEMSSPERIYDYLFAHLPKCPQCGKIGVYSKPQKKDKGQKDQKGKDQKDQPGDKDGKKDKSKGKGKGKDKSKDHDHGEGDKCDDCPGHDKGDQDGDGQGDGDSQDGDQGSGNGCPGHCKGCGSGFNVLDIGGTLDDHIDTGESEEKLAKRIAEAMESAKRMAGSVPGALEDELGKLLKPKMTWKDDIRSFVKRCVKGNSKNDWSRFKIKEMIVGLMTPKRIGYQVKFGCCLDTSGSMSTSDMAFGISQIASLDSGAQGTVTPVDCEVYWDKTTKIVRANTEELMKVKVVGRGGTLLHNYINDYEKNIGKCDFLIMITDGYLSETEFNEMKNPNIPVYWLITSGHSTFKAPFGKIYDLKAL